MQGKTTKKKQKMTLDKLAMITQRQFLDIRKDMKEMVTKEYLDETLGLYATKGDLEQFKEEIVLGIKEENLKVLQSNDKVITKLDILLKEDAAHNVAHKRINDTLYDHDKRIKKIEEKVI